MLGLVWDCIDMVVLGLIVFNLLDLELEKLRNLESNYYLCWLEEVQVGTSDCPISFGSVPLNCSVVKWQVKNLYQRANKRWTRPPEQSL